MSDNKSDPWRYRFVKGYGDERHAVKLNELVKQGYKAVHMVVDEIARPNNEQIVVLMEKE